MALVAAALAEQRGLQPIDKALGQGLHGIGQYHVHAEKVVPCFNDVVYLDGLVVCEYAVCFVQHLDLIAGQAVAGHADVAVYHVDLQVLIETAVLFAVSLLDEGSEKFGKLGGVLFLSRGLDCVFGYVPDAELLVGFGDAVISAMTPDELIRDIPFSCDFACS